MTDSPNIDSVFERVMLETLRPITGGLGAVFLLFLIFNALDLPEGAVRPAVAYDAALIAIFWLLHRLLVKAVIPVHFAHAVAFVVTQLVVSNILLTMRLLEEPFYTVYVMVVIIGAGGLALSLRWVGATIATAFVAWLAVASRFFPAEELAQGSFSLLAGAALAWMLLVSRRATLARLEGLRRRDESRNLELAREVAERREAELKLRALLAEREVLVRETHHLAKNNLQVVESLMSLQARDLSDERAQRALRSSRSRVQSMALVHEQLHHSEDLQSADLSEYTKGLVRALQSTFGDQMRRVAIQLQAESVPGLDLQRILPWGLLLQELVSNCIYHAFVGRPQGEIAIQLCDVGGRIHLVVSDDGIGLPAGITAADGGALGFELIRQLTRQLGGELEITRHQGTRIQVAIPGEAARAQPAIVGRDGSAKLAESLREQTPEDD